MKTNCKNILLASLLFAVSFHAYPQASWVGTSGAYNTASNWNTSMTPTNATNVFINNGGTALITVNSFAANATVGSIDLFGTSKLNLISLFGSTPSFQTNGNVAIGALNGTTGESNIGAGSWFNTNGSFTVGKGGTGILNINSGTVQSNSIAIGLEGTGNGTVKVDGSDAILISNTGTVFKVGDAGLGVLNVLNGGQVASGNSFIGLSSTQNNLVSLGGGNAKWTVAGDLTIGFTGKGTLDINSDSQVNNTSNISSVVLGEESTGSGTVNVNGGTWINQGNLTIGQAGTGTMNINGGTVQSAHVRIGDQIGSNGTVVVGASSSWSNSSLTFFVGNAGKGTLTIQNGGQVTSGASIIGGLVDSNGSSVTVTGTGSRWTIQDDLVIGNSGKNSNLTIASGGNVSVQGGDVTIASQVGSSGILQIGSGSGAGTLSANTVSAGSGTSATLIFNHNQISTPYTFTPVLSGALTVQHDGIGTTILTKDNTHTNTTNVNAGTLLVNTSIGSSATGTGSVVVGFLGTFGGKGTVKGNTLVGGTLAPGLPSGPEVAAQLNFDGDLSFGSSSKLTMEVGETLGMLVSDIIDVKGTSMLDGTLEIKLLPGYLNVAAAGDEFHLFNWNNNLDTATAFADFILPTLNNGLSWDTSNLYSSGVLAVVPEPSTWTLLGLATVFAVFAIRRRKSP